MARNIRQLFDLTGKTALITGAARRVGADGRLTCILSTTMALDVLVHSMGTADGPGTVPSPRRNASSAPVGPGKGESFDISNTCADQRADCGVFWRRLKRHVIS